MNFESIKDFVRDSILISVHDSVWDSVDISVHDFVWSSGSSIWDYVRSRAALQNSVRVKLNDYEF
jgi:hypothetical protein